MRVFSSWRFYGSASLVPTAVLLCFGAFLLSRFVSGSEASAVLTVVGAPHAEHVANGLPIEGKYPAVFADEDEGRDELPKNAVLLRTLVLALFYGPVLAWLLASGRTRSRAEVTSSPFRYCFHSIVHLHQRRAVATLLGVFRL